MSGLLLVQLGPLPPGLVDYLIPRAPEPVAPHRPCLDPAFAYDAMRDQYLASALLEELTHLTELRVLGVTAVDLFSPILTFVFGEGRLPGRAAVFSVHRLREEFYGLPPNRDLLFERAAKEMLHELGHTRGLAHCLDASCVMSSSHSVEGVDRKGSRYCRRCSRLLGAIESGQSCPSIPESR
jgi:archaemetzincin